MALAYHMAASLLDLVRASLITNTCDTELLVQNAVLQ